MTANPPIKTEAPPDVARDALNVQGIKPAPQQDAESDNGAHQSAGSRWSAALGMLGLRTTAQGADDCLTAAQMEELRSLVRGKELKDDVAEEVSATLALAQSIRSRDIYIEGAHDRLKFILDSLLAPKPQLILASDGRLRLQIEVYARSGITSRALAYISAGSPTALVLAALLTSLVLWTCVVLIVRTLVDANSRIATDIFFMDGRAITVIVSAAFIGGVVSIATRLREFSRVRDLDPFAMFWTALLKPLIGVVLAMFILATLAGGVISFGFLESDPFGLTKPPPQAVAPKTLYVLWVLGFLAGFSERFAWDFVDRAQGVAAGGLGGDNKKT